LFQVVYVQENGTKKKSSPGQSQTNEESKTENQTLVKNKKKKNNKKLVGGILLIDDVVKLRKRGGGSQIPLTRLRMRVLDEGSMNFGAQFPNGVGLGRGNHTHKSSNLGS